MPVSRDLVVGALERCQRGRADDNGLLEGPL